MGTELPCYSSLLNLGRLNRDGGFSCYDVVIRGKGTMGSGEKKLTRKVIEQEKENMKGLILKISISYGKTSYYYFGLLTTEKDIVGI